MKSIKLTDDELWMLRIALENELEKYDYWYEPDEIIFSAHLFFFL